jgi:hypothetical protein
VTSPQTPGRNTTLADLLARTALADQRAFAELYRHTSSHLYAVALRILREPAAAEEVLQEAFVSRRPGLRASFETAASTGCGGVTSIR